MGGAFVAVADDPSATHWNPAGLILGQPAGMTIGFHRFQIGNPDAPPLPGPSRRSSSLTSLGTWPIGVSYGRFRTFKLVAGANGETVATSFENSVYAATLLHSIIQGLTVGTTVKYLRGGSIAGLVEGATTGDALDVIADRDIVTNGSYDLDVGVMADFQQLRVGLNWKNLRSPSFGEIEGPANTLPRQARLGLAILPATGLTLAMDVDLDTVALADGPRRMLAVGGEGRLGQRVAVRTGMRWNLEGAGQRVGAIGGSVMIRGGFWLDGHYSQGQTRDDQEYGVAARAGF